MNADVLQSVPACKDVRLVYVCGLPDISPLHVPATTPAKVGLQLAQPEGNVAAKRPTRYWYCICGTTHAAGMPSWLATIALAMVICAWVGIMEDRPRIVPDWKPDATVSVTAGVGGGAGGKGGRGGGDDLRHTARSLSLSPQELRPGIATHRTPALPSLLTAAKYAHKCLPAIRCVGR